MPMRNTTRRRATRPTAGRAFLAASRQALAAALALAVAASFAPQGGSAQQRDSRPAEDAEADVLAAVQALFDAMAARDSAAVADVLIGEGVYFAAGMREGEPVHVLASQGDFARIVGEQPAPLIERMWDAEVLLHDPIAVVWTPYDFHVGEEFSHCGIDAFSLVRTPEGWKIAGIVFTRETEGCPESPLGPVDGVP